MNDFVDIQGPVEYFNGQYILRIPLSAGGDKLIECTKRIGRVENRYLVVTIPSWLADKLGISAGSIVAVSNKDGKFNITRVSSVIH